MTECNRKSSVTASPRSNVSLSFSRLGWQKIVADSDCGRLTSDAGGLLLPEVDRRPGLTADLAEGIADPRDPARIRHDLKTLLAQRVFGIALGYEDLNDHATLRDDPLFAILAEQRPDPETPLGSPSTLCRFENAITRGSLSRMSEVFVEQFIASHKRPPKPQNTTRNYRDPGLGPAPTRKRQDRRYSYVERIHKLQNSRLERQATEPVV